MSLPFFANFKDLFVFYSSKEKESNKNNKSEVKSSKQVQRDRYIREFIEELTSMNYVHDNSSLYHIGGDINSKNMQKLQQKLDVANEAYARGIAHNYILFSDTTMFGSGECGLLFTPKCFYFSADHGDDIRHYIYDELFGLKFKVEGGSFHIGYSEYPFYTSETMKKLHPVVALLTKYFTNNEHLSISRYGR